MTQMESPKRKLQKKNDYQRHKLFRKIKRRRKAQAEAEQQIAEKQLRRKLKLPKFGDGKTREVYTSDIHFNNDDAAGGVDRYGNKFDYIEFPETVVTARKIPTFKDRAALLDNPDTYKWYANNKAQESGYVENPLGDYGRVMNINLLNHLSVAHLLKQLNSMV